MLEAGAGSLRIFEDTPSISGLLARYMLVAAPCAGVFRNRLAALSNGTCHQGGGVAYEVPAGDHFRQDHPAACMQEPQARWRYEVLLDECGPHKECESKRCVSGAECRPAQFSLHDAWMQRIDGHIGLQRQPLARSYVNSTFASFDLCHSQRRPVPLTI